MTFNKNLIIVGDSAFAQVAYEYFDYYLDYKIVGFSVEADYIKQKSLFGLPIFPLEELESFYSPEDTYVFVAVTYGKMNTIRERLYKIVKSKGFKLISFISPKAFVWRNVKIGENVFIFEHNVVQPFVEIGNNVILWSGNHIGHHSKIGDNTFIASHVVISGFCQIGRNCFFGVNSTVANNLNIADFSYINAGAVVLKDTERGKIYTGNPAKPRKVDVFKFFGVENYEVD